MAKKSTINLLLINQSDNECERLISLFRNAGRVARAHRASSAEDLFSCLENNSWDLLIANDKHPEITVEQCLEKLKNAAIKIPVIVIRDNDVQSALDAGATDVISTDDEPRLVFAALRELSNLERYRELISTQGKLADAEERCALLMAKSQEAIAYLADGMLVSANPLFASCFGYDSADELDCAPIIDLISDDNHEKVKSVLKSQPGLGEITTDISFCGLKQNGDTFSSEMQLSNAVYDDEPCIQISVSEQKSATASDSESGIDHDPATGLYSQNYFLSQLEHSIAQAANGGTTSSLLFIGIDLFTGLRSRYGISSANSILLDIAQFIQQQSPDNHCLAHICDDGFALLLADTGAEAALEFAQSLCKKLEQHIIDIGSQSLQCTASIGLLEIDSQNQHSASSLIDKAFSSCELVRENAGSDGTGNGAAIFVPEIEKRSLGDAASDNDLDSYLEEALEDGQFSLLFQPVVSLRGSSGDHYEVQTRMTTIEGEDQEASEFLQALQFEQANTRLDRWIILEATKQLAGPVSDGQDSRLFINLTANSLKDESLIPWLGVALKAGGIPAAAITFQFTENDIIDYLKHAKEFVKSVKELGCKVSISEFGQVDDATKALKQTGADFAKLAHSYAEQLQAGGDIQMLKAMVNSINENQTQAIISGVENAAALAVLWQIGVDYIQGGYLAEPSKQMDYEFTDIA